MESIHASAILLGTRGVLVSGASGSGKSGLCQKLLDRAGDLGGHWVADDRVHLSSRNNRIVARPVSPLSKLAEHRFLGLRHVTHEAAAVMDVWVQLVAPETLDRMPEERWKAPISDGPALRLLQVPNQNIGHGADLVWHWLHGSFDTDVSAG